MGFADLSIRGFPLLSTKDSSLGLLLRAIRDVVIFLVSAYVRRAAPRVGVQHPR
jgi:hypothetical protein